MRKTRLIFPIIILLLVFQACAVPTRTGYDRDVGSYASMPRTGDSYVKPALSSSGKLVTGDSAWDAVLGSWLGTPYRYGGTSREGTDCSGFVMSAYKERTGVTLPRSSKAGFKSTSGAPIDPENLQIGDILYFTNRWGMIDHAAIYIGENRFIHSSTSKGVIITPMDDPYWKRKYKGARRYPSGAKFEES